MIGKQQRESSEDEKLISFTFSHFLAVSLFIFFKETKQEWEMIFFSY